MGMEGPAPASGYLTWPEPISSTCHGTGMRSQCPTRWGRARRLEVSDCLTTALHGGSGMATSQDPLPEQQAKPLEVGPQSRSWHLPSIRSPESPGAHNSGGLGGVCGVPVTASWGPCQDVSPSALIPGIPPAWALGLQVLAGRSWAGGRGEQGG